MKGSSLILLHNIENLHVIMHLSTFFEMQIKKTMCPTFASSIWKYDENMIWYNFVYFQMDKALICINVFLNFSYYSHNLSNFSY
jgi:hypothetical protein